MKKLSLILMLLLTIGHIRVWAEDNGVFEYGVNNNYVSINGFSSEYNLTGVTEVEIPSTINGYAVMSINASAFIENTDEPHKYDNIKSLTIPSTVNYIYQSAFEGWTGLETLKIMSSGELEIHDLAFDKCTSLKTVYILATKLKLIGWVFAEDVALESFDLTNIEEFSMTNTSGEVFNNTSLSTTCTIYVPADFEYDENTTECTSIKSFLSLFKSVCYSGNDGYDYAKMLESLGYTVSGVTLEYVENENVTAEYDQETKTVTTNYDITDGITLKATVSLTYEGDTKYAVIDENTTIATWTYNTESVNIENCVVTDITGAPTTATIIVTAGDFSDQITVNFADYIVGNPILPGYIVVLVGDSEPIEAIVETGDEDVTKITDLYYTYDESQNEYATVEKDENGVIWVTGVKENSDQEVITISLSYGNSSSLDVKIYVNDISEVTLDEEATINLSDGETEKTLTAAITWDIPNHAPPSVAMDVNDWVVWNGSDEKIATVENGTVTAVAPGIVEITVAPKNHPDQITSCIVTVKEIGSLTIPNINSMEIGDVVQLPDVTLNWLPEEKEVIDKDDTNLTWTAISVEGEKEITDGYLTATTTGIIQLYATYKYSENTTVTGITQVSVYEEIIQATTIILTDTVKMIVGETADLLIITDPADATPQPTTWTSSNTEIVTVGQKELLTTTGLLTAITAGKATVTVTYGDVSATCIVVVSEPNGIKNITSDVYEIARYNLAGQRIIAPQKGINIVKYSDGTTKKILVK